MSDKYVTKDDVIKYGTLFYLYKKLQPTKKQLIAYAVVYGIIKIRKPIKATFNYTKDSVKTYKKSGTDGLSDKFVKDLNQILDDDVAKQHKAGTITYNQFRNGRPIHPSTVKAPAKPRKSRAKAKPKTSATSALISP